MMSKRFGNFDIIRCTTVKCNQFVSFIIWNQNIECEKKEEEN